MIEFLSKIGYKAPQGISVKLLTGDHIKRNIPIKSQPEPEVREIKYNKGELIELLSKTGYEVPPGISIKMLAEKCIERNIPLKSPPEPIIQEGWCEKAKGLSQILWEKDFLKEG